MASRVYASCLLGILARTNLLLRCNPSHLSHLACLGSMKTLWTSSAHKTASRLTVVTKSGKEFDLNSEDSQKKMRHFCEKLGCEKDEVVQLFFKYPRLLSMTEAKIGNVLNLFKENHIAKEEVLTYPEIFTYSLNNLEERVRLLKDGGAESLKVVKVKDSQKKFDKKLTKLQTEGELVKMYGTKTKLVAEKLHCSETEAETFLDSVQAMAFVNLEKKLNCILNELLLPTEYVMKHPWVMSYPVRFLQKRCEKINEVGITYENCDSFLHLLTVENRLFVKRLEQHRKEREILGSCRDLTEYLCHRLDCKPADVTLMEKRYPRLLSVNIPKIKQHLDFLIDKLDLPGFDIVGHPRILSFAPETIKKRHQVLLEKGFAAHDINMRILSKSTKQFNKLL